MRLLQAGMGANGRFWVSRTIPQVPEAELVGCVDLDPAALARAQEGLGVPADRCFTSLDAGLEATAPDAVVVVTTLDSHVAVCAAALEAGCHVFTEKPFAPTVEEARALVELADARDRVLMVGQNYRFYPAVLAAAGLVREGTLGPLHEVEIDFRHDSTAAMGAGGHRLLDQPLLVDMAIHHFDLLRVVTGLEPEQISCHAWNPPWSGFAGPPAAVATILLPGVVATYRGSWLAGGENTAWAGEWRMTFERGEAWWTSRRSLTSVEGDRVVVRAGGGEPAELSLPEMPLVDRAAALVEFIDAVRSGREPESSGRDNLPTLALALAAVESADRREPVPL